MLVIRKEQLEAFTMVTRSSFAAAMAAHLRAHFPDEVGSLDDASLQRHVEKAIERAGGYGLTTQKDVGRFLNLLVMFGWDSDQNTQHEWLHSGLTDPAISESSARLDRVAKQAILRLQAAEDRRRRRRVFGVED